MKKWPIILAELYVINKSIRISYSSDSYLRRKGFANSLRKGIPVDVDNNPLPWMNYNVVEFLESRLNKEMDVFEYGCGYSTLYLQDRVKSVTSVESDEFWHENMTGRAASNVRIIHCPLDEEGKYALSIMNDSARYDIVIVDGRDRVNCIKNSLDNLKEGGIVILDDSMREKYNEGVSFLRDHGFKSITFSGMKPCSIRSQETTVFYRQNNCFNI